MQEGAKYATHTAQETHDTQKKSMLNGEWRIPDQQLVKLVLSQGGGGTWRTEKMWVVLGGAYLLPTTYPALKPSCCCLVWPILSSVATLTIEPPTCIAECYVFILLLYRNYARKGAFTKSSAPQHLIIFGPLWLHIYERYVFDEYIPDVYIFLQMYLMQMNFTSASDI